MARRSKRYREIRAKVDTTRQYSVREAVEVLKSLPHARFDESVEVAVRLGIDPKQSDQAVRGTVTLPKGTGKTVRVIVFAEGEAAQAAQRAGAIAVGGADLVERVNGGWTDFDVAIATPAMMQHVRKLGRVLGPQGKMPTPKTGTVTDDVASAVRDFMHGKVEYRNDDSGNVHVLVGKISFTTEDLVANIEAFLSHLAAARPPAAKGRFLVRASVSTTMGPALRLAV